MLGDFSNLKIKVPTKVQELPEIIAQLEARITELEEKGAAEIQEKINKVQTENPEEERGHQKRGQAHKQQKAKFAEEDFPEMTS